MEVDHRRQKDVAADEVAEPAVVAGAGDAAVAAAVADAVADAVVDVDVDQDHVAETEVAGATTRTIGMEADAGSKGARTGDSRTNSNLHHHNGRARTARRDLEWQAK